MRLVSPDATQRSPGVAQHRPVTMHRGAGTQACGTVYYLRVFGLAFAVFGVALSIASTRLMRE